MASATISASSRQPPAGLAYPFLTPPESGALIAVAPGVYWLRMPLPFVLDHINLWLLRDRDSPCGQPGWTLVDTGFALESVQLVWEQVLARLDGPIVRIIATHFHPDHVGLADWLQQRYPAAPLLMTAGEFLSAHAVWHEIAGHGVAAMLAQFRHHGLDEVRLAALAARGNGYRKGVSALPQTYQRLIDGQILHIGGRAWQIIDGQGHSPEHAMLYCAELGVLISGDMLLPKISTNVSVFAGTPDDDALQRYLDALSRYVAMIPEATLILPSHGLPFTGLKVRVEALQAHHAERLGVLEENCTVPRCAAELLETLFPRALDTHQTLFAMGEAIAHLNHLERTRRLSRCCDSAGIVRFVQADPAS